MPSEISVSELQHRLKTQYISEVANELGMKPQTLRYFCRKNGLKLQKKPGQFNRKYSMDFRLKAIELYRTHNARECAKKLGISHQAMIGIMETSRRMGLIGGKFKDTRNKKPWTFDEQLELICMAGLINRSEIGKRLNRCGQRNIKERMRNYFNSGTKHMHGIPLTWVREIIPMNLDDRIIQTKAGPTGQRGIFHFKIVPWVDLEHVQYALKLPDNLSSAIRAMAKFQRFVWQEDRDWIIRKRIMEVIYE